jgi:squalene synthase HpnC
MYRLSSNCNRFKMSSPRTKSIPSPAEVIDSAAIESRNWSVEEAFRFCERLARSHYENFPVGSILVRKNLRKHFYSIYAFARIADDFADEGYSEPYTEAERLAWLDEWGRKLVGAYEGRATHPVFLALTHTAGLFSLPISLFEDLLSAFRQDVTVRRYNSYHDLLDYCRRSANPIGRLILLLFGHRDAEMHSRSDDICTALQLANHWQDVKIDLDKDRVYLPVDDMLRFGITAETLKHDCTGDQFRGLMALEVDRARALFDQGKPLCAAATGRLGLELRAVWLGGTTILARIEKAGYDVFNNRPRVTTGDKLRILITALKRSAFESG